MNSHELTAFIALAVINIIAGMGCTIPLARWTVQVVEKSARVFRYVVFLVGIYCIECLSMAVGMGIPVFSVGLSFVWGVVFGLWLRNRASVRQVLKASLFLSLYTCLPAVSFITIPVVSWIGGRNILSVEEAILFGIPEFPPVLRPVSTILGFYAALAIGAVVFKTVITTGEVSFILHLGEKEDKKCLTISE
jgi:hypothetical protein